MNEIAAARAARLSSMDLISDHRLIAAMAALGPSCRMPAEELQRRVSDVVLRYVFEAGDHSTDRQADWRRVAQARNAAQKLLGLLQEPGVSAALHHSGLPIQARGAQAWGLGDALDALPGLITAIDTAAAARGNDDLRRDAAVANLVARLAEICVEATGQPLTLPTYDPVSCTISGAFPAFFRIVTVEILASRPLSDEALRHRIRDVLDFGGVAPKIVGHRLWTDPAPVRTKEATQQQVVHDNDEQPSGRRHRGRRSPRP